MKKILFVMLCAILVHYAFAQTYTYRLTKVVNSDTGELLEKINGDKELIYITFTNSKRTCYETDAYGNRINRDNEQPNQNNLLNMCTEGSNYYHKYSNANGIITFKCTYKMYSYKRTHEFVPQYQKVLSGEHDDYLYFSTDYKKLNINNTISSRDYNHQTKTYTESFMNGKHFGDKRTRVYERVDNLQVKENTPKQLW